MAAVLRAMGVESDQEILALVGSEPGLAALLAPTLQEAKSLGLFIQQQALEYLGECSDAMLFMTRAFISQLRCGIRAKAKLVHLAGSRLKAGKQQYSSRRTRSKVDEVRDVLANVVVCHIPVHQFDYQQKVGSFFVSGAVLYVCQRSAGLTTHALGQSYLQQHSPCMWRFIALCMSDTVTWAVAA